MNGRGKIAGPALIVVGLLMLLGQMGMPLFGVLWPLILLAIGVGMILRYRQGGEDSGLIFSGVLLILLTLLLLGAKADVLQLSRHWPAFLGVIGISFLAMAQVDSKRRDAMVPGWICLGLAAVLYFFSLGLFTKLLGFLVRLLGTLLKVVIPLGLMGLGGWLLFHDRHDRSEAGGTDFPEKVSPVGDPGPEPETEAATEPEVGDSPEPAGVEDDDDLADAEDAEFEAIDEPEDEPYDGNDAEEDAGEDDEPRRES